MKQLRAPWSYGASSTGLLHLIDTSSVNASRPGGPFAACGVDVEPVFGKDATSELPETKVCANCAKRYQEAK